MVLGMRFKVIIVSERGGIGVTKEEGKEGVTIIDLVEFLSFHKLLQVVLDNGFLVEGSGLGSGGVDVNAITKGEDVVILVVLESVGVYAHHTVFVTETSINEFLLRLASRVD